MKKIYNVIGLMSGTSLDGLDIAYCELRINRNKWESTILEAETVNYTHVWKQILQEAPGLDGLGLSLLHTSYGHWIGQTVNQFIKKFSITPDLIASHGHTVFHRPQDRMTLQIGSGPAIAAETGITTISDFRSLNIALGGQGAPLVPMGDKLLFGEYDACVNIGGFANISIKNKKGRVAFDICPVNIVLNLLAEEIGLPFDPLGSNAKGGRFNKTLFDKLEILDYYFIEGPRSLGKEWVEKEILPLLKESRLSISDLLCTFTHHAAVQISKALPKEKGNRAIFTGGGTHNSFLIELIREKSQCEIIIPSDKVIEYKEALVFALLGVLRFKNLNNCLAEATGACCDCSSGAVHIPPRK